MNGAEEGAILAQEGIARAAAGASDEWKAAMYQCLVDVAKKNQQFTADEVFELSEKRGVIPHTENRAFGAIMILGRKNRICAKTKTFPETRPSNRPELHRGREQIWDSLVFIPTKELEPA